MDIQKYAGYFHDGIVYDIKQSENELIFSLESAELRPEWNEDNIVLSKRNSICGRIHLLGVRKIIIDEKISTDQLEMTYDEGNIYDLEVNSNRVLLCASWENYHPKTPEVTDFFIYKIEAEKIYWENIPTAFDESWDALD